MTRRSSFAIATTVAIGLTACSADDRLNQGSESATTITTGGETTGATGNTGSASDSDSDGTSDSGGQKFDVGASDLGNAGCANPDGNCGCSFVDIVFVIDNSVSMGDYQNALTLAFPEFVDAIVDTLPPGTNVHVGVTSTTMGMSSSGQTTNCSAVGDNNQPPESFYQTPDAQPNGINGAQGRLFDPGDGKTYYEFSTDASAAELQNVKDWFTGAAKIGEDGSQVEMATAGAGWVAGPGNDATNAGFIRDEGAVLVVFFVQDEPDQTPWTIDGKPGGTAMIEKLAAAKSGCGGGDCIVGGGFIDEGCLPEVPLSDFFAGMGKPEVTAELPDEDLAEDFPDQAAAEMADLLRENLTLVIGQKCQEIPPVG